jgi:hypothetical protein
MKRAILMLPLLGLTACLTGGYTSAGVVWSEPVEYVYVEPIDHVVVVSREVLVTNGYTVYRVTRSGYNRIIWAHRGNDEMVRIFVSPSGSSVAVRGVIEVRERGDRGRHRGWERRGSPNRVLAAINGKLKSRGRDRGR